MKETKKKPILLWKSMRVGLKSESKGFQWKPNAWFKEENISICNSGFHASERPTHAMGYVNCEILARVEVRGESIIQDDKQCWSEMRIIKSYDWSKEDSVSLAIFAAELVIDIYEKEYQNDKRPREAIEAAKEWIKNPTTASASYAASSAAASASYAAASYAASSASYAAASAAYAAAAYASAASASSASAYAASAYAAAYAAAAYASSAYASAAASKIRDKCDVFILKRLKLKK